MMSPKTWCSDSGAVTQMDLIRQFLNKLWVIINKEPLNKLIHKRLQPARKERIILKS